MRKLSDDLDLADAAIEAVNELVGEKDFLGGTMTHRGQPNTLCSFGSMSGFSVFVERKEIQNSSPEALVSLMKVRTIQGLNDVKRMIDVMLERLGVTE